MPLPEIGKTQAKLLLGAGGKGVVKEQVDIRSSVRVMLSLKSLLRHQMEMSNLQLDI